ncbi:threonine--tRNA ligase [Alphaproteobacteria bacterium]|nr:threonine--tRNA ligase [Alphaproteobacteria bacterium]
MEEKLEVMRHSLAHIMAAAVVRLWPGAKLGVGPAVNDGFYYDFDLGDATISEADFKNIEKEMRAIINQKLDFVQSEKTYDEAVKWAKDSGQSYKLELIEDLKAKNEPISFYSTGDFVDLCRGPHVVNTSEIDASAFKILRIAGAYWKGDEKNPQMQRLYAVAFNDKAELTAHLEMLEEARKRDHRKLGQELDLFAFSPLVGSGLPLFTPRGTILRDKLNELAQEYRLKNGYQKVWIPHIANLELFKTSGHYEKFPEMLKFISDESGDELALKPVSCPHHSQIFASVPRSYRELPVKYLETTTVYRDEKKGELGGLSRVRAITQDDSHVFCTYEQVEGVFGELIESAKDLYRILDMKLSLRLSFRDDGDGYIGDEKLWQKAQSSIEAMAKKFEMDYEVGLGEAAMYGPKMDFMATDAIGRKWQLATVQLDYALPERFGLEYVDKNGDVKRPAMIHCALLGSIERFLSIYIEHTAGKFPVWCAPEQLRIIKVKDDPKIDQFAAEIVEKMRDTGIRVGLDDSNNSVGKKIRSAEVAKVPYSVALGEKEVESGKLSVRVRGDIDSGSGEKVYATNDLVKKIADEITDRVKTTTL